MTTPTITDVHEVAGRLLDEARRTASGRAAETIVSGSVQRSTVVALTTDTAMAEHDSPPAALVHVISGRVRMHTHDEEWVLGAGHVASVPSRRHAVEALEDSALLLTVALHG